MSLLGKYSETLKKYASKQVASPRSHPYVGNPRNVIDQQRIDDLNKGKELEQKYLEERERRERKLNHEKIKDAYDPSVEFTLSVRSESMERELKAHNEKERKANNQKKPSLNLENERSLIDDYYVPRDTSKPIIAHKIDDDSDYEDNVRAKKKNKKEIKDISNQKSPITNNNNKETASKKTNEDVMEDVRETNQEDQQVHEDKDKVDQKDDQRDQDDNEKRDQDHNQHEKQDDQLQINTDQDDQPIEDEETDENKIIIENKRDYTTVLDASAVSNIMNENTLKKEIKKALINQGITGDFIIKKEVDL
jgi:hypothetical protein